MSSGCYCACGQDGHDACYYAYTSDLPNWRLESVVSASPKVNFMVSYDVVKKNVTVAFENQPVKYVKHSRNGKVKYTNMSSPCRGLPGKPPDYSGDTQEEGYALGDECVFAYDPLTPDHIVGKYHLDQPKPALFWDEYTKNLQKEYEKGGGFNYQLTRFQYDFEVDLRKVKIKK